MSGGGPSVGAEVDIVIPAFDPGPWLRLALASVLAQTFTTWSATVIDDGSTEDLGWVDALDPRIVRIRQANSGPSAARNRGIAAGSSPYVAFLDSDDLWRPNKLAVQLSSLKARPSVGLSSTAFEIVGTSGEILGAGYQGYAGSYAELLAGNGICLSTTMVPRSVLTEVGNFDVSLFQVQDWDLWLRIARQHDVIRLSEVLAGYRHHGANISLNYRRLLREGSQILRAHEVSANEEGRDCHREAARLGLRRLRGLTGAQAFDHFRLMARTDTRRAAKHLLAALSLAPAYTAGAVIRKLANRTRGNAPTSAV